jgi:Flp pilus assembly protein TadD
MNDLAVLLMLSNRKPEAKKLLEKALEIHPDDALAADNLRRLKAEGGKAGG